MEKIVIVLHESGEVGVFGNVEYTLVDYMFKEEGKPIKETYTGSFFDDLDEETKQFIKEETS